MTKVYDSMEAALADDGDEEEYADDDQLYACDMGCCCCCGCSCGYCIDCGDFEHDGPCPEQEDYYCCEDCG